MAFDNIISIHGTPRSGTTWLGQILDSSPETQYKFQPLFSYAFKDYINLNSTKNEIMDFYNQLYYYNDVFLDQVKQKESGVHPTFLYKDNFPNTLVTKMVRYHYLIPHLIDKTNNIKFILIIRNPLGVLKSWKLAPREFKPEWNFDEEWEFAQSKNDYRPEEYFGYHKWKESTKLFLELEKNHPEKVKIIKYEDLVTNPVQLTNEIFEFVNFDISEQTRKFIKDSTEKEQDDVYSVYKGKKDVNDWVNFIENPIVEKIKADLKGTEMEVFLQ